MIDIDPVKMKKRDKKKCFAITQEENRVLEQTAAMMGMNQTELIVYAVKKVRQLELQKMEMLRHDRERAGRSDQAGRFSS